MQVGHTAKMTLVAAALMVLVAVGGVYHFLSTAPSPYPIPVANISVSLPTGVPYKQLTAGTWNDRWPSWSPDEKHIAYVSDKGGMSSLHVMDPSGSHSLQVSDGNQMIAYLSWSPNGANIAFSANLGGFYHVWVVNSNGAAGSTAGVGGY